MTDKADFKIKGAASGTAETESKDATAPLHADKEAEKEAQLKRYRWCRCECEPNEHGLSAYYIHLDTRQSQWQTPNEPYWLWDAEKQDVHESGLQNLASTREPSEEPDPSYTGYNPKIHGDYDPNADYAQYHKRKREEETGVTTEQAVPAADAYAVIGAFNRATGHFQAADKNPDRHNDYNKAMRQQNNYFDADAAANSHDGRSLKEERRNQKLSKAQIKEMAAARKERKLQKRMDFLTN